MSALPSRVVAVAHRERRRRCRLARQESAVEPRQLTHEKRQRPAVSHDVVQVENQQVFLGGDAQQVDAQQRARGQVEGPLYSEAPLSCRLGLSWLGIEPREVREHQGQRRSPGSGDPQYRFAVFFAERGAQPFLTRDQDLQAAAQQAHLERARKPQDRRDVVGRARPLEAVEEPQPLLGERELRGVPRWEPLQGR